VENRSNIISLLSILLSNSETVERRERILEEEFDIPMTKRNKRGVAGDV